jgi:hypothetical protein
MDPEELDALLNGDLGDESESDDFWIEDWLQPDESDRQVD